jgi:hypothetical protein
MSCLSSIGLRRVLSYIQRSCPNLTIQRYKVLRSADEPCRYEWVNVDVLRCGMERALRQS